MDNIRNLIDLLESKKTLELKPLPYAQGDLAPALSADNIKFHFGTLARNYVKRYNAGEGDADFNAAGAFLHNTLFEQFHAPADKNTPNEVMMDFVSHHFDNYRNFQTQFETTAMPIQGSGWVYLSRSGKIKTIRNHEIRDDIVLLVDWWEHAFQPDYGSDKKAYLANIWKIINWSVIAARLK
jgi:Fe-Mn family superoxide dismutase